MLGFYNWSVRVYRMSGEYIKDTAIALMFGVEVSGIIEKVRSNEDISIPDNYLATVSYTTLENKKITRDFRYANKEVPLNTKVHVFYNSTDPEKGALKEDAGYFKFGLYLLPIFLILFMLPLAGIAFLIYRLGKSKSHTIS